MELACFCGVEDSRKCRCLPVQVPRGQRGSRYENRGGGRGGNARGGHYCSTNRGRDESSWRDRDGSTWRDRDGSSWRDQDGSSWRDRDGSSWRDRGEHPKRGMDRGTRGGRNRSARGVKSPLLPVPSCNTGESTAWRGGLGRGSNDPKHGGARFPGNAVANRGGYRNVGHQHSDGIESEGYYESTFQSYYDEGNEGYHDFVGNYHDDMVKWGNNQYQSMDYRGYGTDGSYDEFLQHTDSGGSRGEVLYQHPNSRGADRGRFGVRGNRNSRERGAHFRGSGARNGRTHSCSGSIERRPDGAFANRSDLDHDSDSEQRNTLIKNKSSTSKKEEKKKDLVGKTKTDMKIPGKSIDNLKGLNQKGNACKSEKGNSSASHNSRKNRSPKKDSNTCPLGNSRIRNNSASSNGSNSSRNTSDSSVNASNSREKRGKSNSSSSESRRRCSVGDRVRKSDSSRRKRDDRRRMGESSRSGSGSSRSGSNGSSSEQQNTSVQNKSSLGEKDENKNFAGKTKAVMKIPGKSIDNLKGTDEKRNFRETKQGDSSSSHYNRKKDGNKCPLGNSRSRNNSTSSNGSNRSRDTSDSSVNAKNSRQKRDKSYIISSQSENSRSVRENRVRKSDSSRKKRDISRRKRGERRKKVESSRTGSGSRKSRSKRISDCSESSDENDSSNGSSRCSSASSSCSIEGHSQRKRTSSLSRHSYLKRGQERSTKSGNQHKTLKDKHLDNSSNNVSGENEIDGARKSLHTSNRKGKRNSENHRDRNSSNNFSHTRGSKKVGSSDESNETKDRAASETKTSKELSHQKFEGSGSSKNRIDAPSNIIKIGNAYVMDGADPLVLTEEEYKFMIGSGAPSPQIGSIVHTTQSLPFSSDSLSSKATILTGGDSLKSGTAPFPVIRYEWQFQDEQKSWITYGQPSAEGSPAFAATVSSDDIEKHYINDPNKQPVEIESNSVRYILDFTTMTQTNTHTSCQRRIRRVLKRPQAQTAPIKLLKSSSASNIDYAWQFYDENGVWITYGEPSTKGSPESATSVSSDDIEQHFMKHPTEQILKIQSNSYQYILDFTAMTQTNKQTLGQRHIRRVSKHLLNQSATPNIGVNAGGLTNGLYEWQFRDEHHAWIRYGSPNSSGDPSCVTSKSSDDIDIHYCSDPNKSPFLIQNKKYQYQLNFQTMTQTNLHTKTQRPIRRVAAQAPKSTHNQKTPQNDVPSAIEHEWFFLDESNRWIAYGQPNSQNKLECVTSISSDDIEKHYQQDPNKKFYITSQQHQYLVNFLEMTQTNTMTNTVRIIRRLRKNSSAAHSARGSFSHDSSAESLPTNWSTMPSSAPWTKVALGSSDPEYTSHIIAIQSAVPNINVVNMYRVQNKFLWKAYANKMEYLKQQFPAINYKEQFLYHGTDPAHVEAICQENVDWRLHGSKNGNSYGRGSYFSNSAQISAGYSTGHNRRTMAAYGSSTLNIRAHQRGLFSAPQQIGGIPSPYPTRNPLHALQQQGLYNATQQQAVPPAPAKAMFIVRVLVGNITQGNSSTVRPPVDSSGQPFDTTVNNVANPTIFVKYDTQEYYPEYYIEFE